MTTHAPRLADCRLNGGEPDRAPTPLISPAAGAVTGEPDAPAGLQAEDMALGVDGVCAATLRYACTPEALAQLSADNRHRYPRRNASLVRQIDFLAGRTCAERALHRAGLAMPAAIGTGSHGEPLWPPGFRGSISHGDGLAIAIVARESRAGGLGVDVQTRIEPGVAAEIRGRIATPEELALCAPAMDDAWLTLVFSAKESLFKALFPQVGTYFEFLDATLCAVHDARLTLRLNATLSPQHVRGRCYDVVYGWMGTHAWTCCCA